MVPPVQKVRVPVPLGPPPMNKMTTTTEVMYVYANRRRRRYSTASVRRDPSCSTKVSERHLQRYDTHYLHCPTPAPSPAWMSVDEGTALTTAGTSDRRQLCSQCRRSNAHRPRNIQLNTTVDITPSAHHRWNPRNCNDDDNDNNSVTVIMDLRRNTMTCKLRCYVIRVTQTRLSTAAFRRV